MLKIQYQKNSGKIILPIQAFERMLSVLKSKKIEFEEVEFMTKEEEQAYDEALLELTNGEAVKYDDLLRMRTENNVRN